ncbi:MAG: hypothetical protein ACRDYV_02020 [Acidimicrobiia bacterium]
MTGSGGTRGRQAGRMAVVVMAGALAVPWVAVPSGAEDQASSAAAAAGPEAPDIYEARAEVGGVADSLAVPALFETFTPYSLSEASNGASHGLHAVFYPGFLLSAAAFQQGFPPPPGTTETLFPQGPLEGTAEAFPISGGGGGRLPQSSGHSDATSSSGEAVYGEFAPSPELSVDSGLAHSTAGLAGTAVRSAADVVMKDVRLGGGALVIQMLSAAGEATADGNPGGAKAAGSVVMTGATLMGTSVVLTPNGLQVGGAGGEAPAATPVDTLLAQAGISFRRLPDTRVESPDGTESRLDLGGVEVRFDQPDREFGVGIVMGRVSVRARAVHNEPQGLGEETTVPAPVTDLPAQAPGVILPVDSFGGTPAVDATPDRFVTVRIPGSPTPAPSPAPAVEGATASLAAPAPVPGRVGQAATNTVPAESADWSTLSGLIALAAPGALIVRRILRAASTP